MAATAGKKPMTTPVKPPMGNLPLQSAEELSEIARGQLPASAYGGVTEVSNGSGVGAPAAVQSTTVEQIIGGLKSGTIEVNRAVTLLVERAIEQSTSFGSPSAAARKELESIFRNALQEDPALVSLVKNLRNFSP
jgi:hypothetical protein